MDLTVLFQLIFTFTYNTFNKKNFNFSKINRSQTDPNYLRVKELFISSFGLTLVTTYLVEIKKKIAENNVDKIKK